MRPRLRGMKTHYHVIIAGAGPVGLFLAGELAAAGCSVLILEKAADPHSPLKQLPFGMRGLSAPSIAALHQRGVLDVSAASIKPGGHFAGIPFDAANVDTSKWPTDLPLHWLSELAELEAELTRRALALGVEVQRGFAITGCRQNQDGVCVQAGDRSFHADWLVGCDGARSVVRKEGGFEFAGTEPEFTGYSAKVDLVDADQLQSGRVMTPQGVYVHSQPGYLNLQDFDGGAFHGQPVTREHLQALLRRISGTDATISALHIATTWTDRARQATRYRNGRILLAGDAAHIHSPLGGQGLNLGLGDAMNLGWKLAATIHHTAPEGLLDSYHDERHPVGAKVLDWSRAQVAIMRPTPASRALNAIFRDLMKTRDGATYFASRVWGLSDHA